MPPLVPKNRSSVRSAAVAIALSLAAVSPAAAQATVGCTMPGINEVPIIGPVLQEAANVALAFACSAHDSCYQACMPSNPAILASRRAECDLEFYARWHAECLVLLAYFAEEHPDESQRVFEVCEAGGLAAYFGLVAVGGSHYYPGQCVDCCNASACGSAGMSPPPWCFPNNGCYGDPACECEQAGGSWEMGEDGQGICFYSPILINLQSNAATDHLTSAADGVRFDIAARGVATRVAWPRKGSLVAFLALDRNGNGIIDDGSELFGTATRKRDGTLAANGFEALREFDDNGDGRIDASDAIYPSLRLWVDLDHDGRSPSHEQLTLEQGEIVALYTAYSESPRRDRFGNQYRYRGVALTGTDSEAHRRRMFDVFLATLPE